MVTAATATVGSERSPTNTKEGGGVVSSTTARNRPILSTSRPSRLSPATTKISPSSDASATTDSLHTGRGSPSTTTSTATTTSTTADARSANIRPAIPTSATTVPTTTKTRPKRRGRRIY